MIIITEMRTTCPRLQASIIGIKPSTLILITIIANFAISKPSYFVTATITAIFIGVSNKNNSEEKASLLHLVIIITSPSNHREITRWTRGVG